MTRKETVSLLILPYLRGELADSEKAEFERYLAENPDFQSEIDFQSQIMAARPSHEETGLEFGWARLSRDIDNLDQTANLPAQSPAETTRMPNTRGLWRVAAVCLACISLGQAVYISTSDSDQKYQLASENVTTGTTLQIGFSGDTKLSAVSEFLLSQNAEISSGPSKLGIYTLTFPTREACDIAVENMKRDNQFVETYTNCSTLS